MSFVDSILAGKTRKAEFYDILGCGRSSTVDQITAEYRARVKAVHPDKREKGDEKANEEFAKLQEAYSTLTDDVKRRTYDNWLDSPIGATSTFEEFSRNLNSIKMSTHWAHVKEQPMLETGKKEAIRVVNEGGKWADGGRYRSDAAEKFRNYQL